MSPPPGDGSQSVGAIEAEIAELRRTLERRRGEAPRPGFFGGLWRGLAVVLVFGLLAAGGLMVLLRNFRMPGG